MRAGSCDRREMAAHSHLPMFTAISTTIALTVRRPSGRSSCSTNVPQNAVESVDLARSITRRRTDYRPELAECRSLSAQAVDFRAYHRRQRQVTCVAAEFAELMLEVLLGPAFITAPACPRSHEPGPYVASGLKGLWKNIQGTSTLAECPPRMVPRRRLPPPNCGTARGGMCRLRVASVTTSLPTLWPILRPCMGSKSACGGYAPVCGAAVVTGLRRRLICSMAWKPRPRLDPSGPYPCFELTHPDNRKVTHDS
jgi:hypothetical protein